MEKFIWTCSRCGCTSTSALICLCPDLPPSDWEVSSSKFVSSKPKEEMLKDIRDSSTDYDRLERYTILKDKKYFASFTEREESRFGNPMSYEEFLKEYNLCISYWEKNRSVSPKRFSYIIEYI